MASFTGDTAPIIYLPYKGVVGSPSIAAGVDTSALVTKTTAPTRQTKQTFPINP